MKNLYCLAQKSANFGAFPLGPSTRMVVDSNNSDMMYVVLADASNNDYVVYRLNRLDQVGTRILSVPGEIVGIEHLALTDELCIATAAGEVMVFQSDGMNEPEVVTFCSGGLQAMGWSPEQEVVAFVDCNSNVVTMNAAYDPINEICLQDDTFGDREFMSVGWGKKETQFHGSEGKSAARVKKEEVDALSDTTQINSKVNISWRADGEYFVVGFLGPFGRAFKVISKEGALQFTSEKCYGLEAALAWRPSGLWIATPQVLKDKYVIALFEKNGLKHREIDLPFNQSEEVVRGLYWSQDSEILVVHTLKQAKELNCLYFMIICNYHWYNKQYLEYGTNIVGIHWDIKYSQGKILHILLENGDYEAIRWEFAVNNSDGLEKSDEALVAVIDGKSLLLTNFRGVVIPPPMCGYTLNTNEQMNAVSFLRNPGDQLDSNCFIVVDSRNRVTFHQPEIAEDVVHHLKGVLNLGKTLEIGTGRYSHWLWLRPDVLLVVEGCNQVTVFRINISEGKFESLQSLKVGSDTDCIGCIEGINGTSAIIELMTGQTFQLDLLPSIILKESLKLPEFCEQLRVRPLKDDKFKVYSLKNRQTLYANGSKIASDVTSIFLTEHYLLFTTIAELKFVDVESDAVIGERRVERGSKLVVVVPKFSRTVFQLPRGNLEAIAPRVLTLDLVADHLNALEYHKAFDILRKERINLNLIVDHNPQLFLSNLDRFLREIVNANWLNLFISDLANQDVCQSMYESNYRNRKAPVIEGYKVEAKVSLLCDQLLHALNEADRVRADYTLPKITCHVKQGKLEEALEVIWDLKKTQRNEKAAEEALKYLLYLVEVNDLFNVALGMYDFGLVLYVATKSQKDPKEYLPFLNELKRLDENYRKYKIDCHLKRFERAIESISRYGDDEDKFQEALHLTIKHGLYTKAMSCYRGNEKYFARICTSYGDHLRQSNKPSDASLIYEKARDYRQAIASARNAVDWERCVRLAKDAKYDESELERLAHSLIPALQEAGNYEAAARLAKEFLNDGRKTIEILLKDHLFEQALLEAHICDRTLVDDVIRPNLEQYLHSLVETIANEKEQFLKQKNRLLVVREEKTRKKLEQHNEEDDGHDVEDCDLYSDTSTVASSRYTSSSGRSGKSHRSGKNRRKHERKLLSLKEGNPFEDIALVDALHALVARICAVERQRHIRTVCKVAIELDHLEKAAQVQTDFGDLFHLVKFSLDAIWIPEMIVPGSGQDVEAVALATGDLSAVQNAQHYALIKPHQRFKPELQSISWQFEILK
ncbi:elongator complex protein 1 [Toxorhynchites rutilus septentrionalis]|uniref:elongator complex protein 1 n=1 Tax=Toxorhynchites rutilus septentrionalis TaxID=329112 RepID=UPI00247B12DC|nr:elongator complex protein 1 [Toxorhynchites rutilus septentrionalis]